MFNEYLERLGRAVTSGEFSEEVINARKEYFSKVGEVFEDDKSFENKMISFTEWYYFDRILKKYQKTALEYFIDNNQTILQKEELEIYKEFLKNIHSVFYVKKLKIGEIIVKDLCGSKIISVSQNNSKQYFLKGDIFEGRLIPFKEKYYFSDSVCFHPISVYRKIKGALKKINKNQEDKKEFIFLLSSMNLILERSRKVNIKDIYVF